MKKPVLIGSGQADTALDGIEHGEERVGDVNLAHDLEHAQSLGSFVRFGNTDTVFLEMTDVPIAPGIADGDEAFVRHAVQIREMPGAFAFLSRDRQRLFLILDDKIAVMDQATRIDRIDLEAVSRGDVLDEISATVRDGANAKADGCAPGVGFNDTFAQNDAIKRRLPRLARQLIRDVRIERLSKPLHLLLRRQAPSRGWSRELFSKRDHLGIRLGRKRVVVHNLYERRLAPGCPGTVNIGSKQPIPWVSHLGLLAVVV